MDKIKELFDKAWMIQIIKSCVVVLFSIIFYKIFSYFLTKGENSFIGRLHKAKKGKTYAKLIKSIIRYIFILMTCLVLLQINGINVTSVVAGVGVLGVVFGLAMQDFLKDIIRGSTILSDNYFVVGDIIKYKDIEGKVLEIGIKTTKVMEIKTGNIISIANRNIEEVSIVSNLLYINIPMPYEVSVGNCEKAISDIESEVLKDNLVEEFNYKGVNELDSSSVNYLIEIKCDPLVKNQVKRNTLKTILLCLEKNKIEVPYTQIDIHNK